MIVEDALTDEFQPVSLIAKAVNRSVYETKQSLRSLESDGLAEHEQRDGRVFWRKGQAPPVRRRLLAEELRQTVHKIRTRISTEHRDARLIDFDAMPDSEQRHWLLIAEAAMEVFDGE